MCAAEVCILSSPRLCLSLPTKLHPYFTRACRRISHGHTWCYTTEETYRLLVLLVLHDAALEVRQHGLERRHILRRVSGQALGQGLLLLLRVGDGVEPVDGGLAGAGKLGDLLVVLADGDARVDDGQEVSLERVEDVLVGGVRARQLRHNGHGAGNLVLLHEDVAADAVEEGDAAVVGGCRCYGGILLPGVEWVPRRWARQREREENRNEDELGIHYLFSDGSRPAMSKLLDLFQLFFVVAGQPINSLRCDHGFISSFLLESEILGMER